VAADVRIADRPVLVDQEDGRPRDIQRVDPEAVPHAVGFRHVAPLIDQDVEGKASLLDVPADGLALLREDADDLDAAGGVGVDVGGELTEPVAAVRSPGAAMEGEQQAAPRQEVGQRSRPSFLIDDQESRGACQRGHSH